MIPNRVGAWKVGAVRRMGAGRCPAGGAGPPRIWTPPDDPVPARPSGGAGSRSVISTRCPICSGRQWFHPGDPAGLRPDGGGRRGRGCRRGPGTPPPGSVCGTATCSRLPPAAWQFAEPFVPAALADSFDRLSASVCGDVVPVRDRGECGWKWVSSRLSWRRWDDVPTDAGRTTWPARDRTLRLVDFDDDELGRQYDPLMSPLVWDLAHIGQQEELWLPRDGNPALPRMFRPGRRAALRRSNIPGPLGESSKSFRCRGASVSERRGCAGLSMLDALSGDDDGFVFALAAVTRTSTARPCTGPGLRTCRGAVARTPARSAGRSGPAWPVRRSPSWRALFVLGVDAADEPGLTTSDLVRTSSTSRHSGSVASW